MARGTEGYLNALLDSLMQDTYNVGHKCKAGSSLVKIWAQGIQRACRLMSISMDQPHMFEHSGEPIYRYPHWYVINISNVEISYTLYTRLDGELLIAAWVMDEASMKDVQIWVAFFSSDCDTSSPTVYVILRFSPTVVLVNLVILDISFDDWVRGLDVL